MPDSVQSSLAYGNGLWRLAEPGSLAPDYTGMHGKRCSLWYTSVIGSSHGFAPCWPMVLHHFLTPCKHNRTGCHHQQQRAVCCNPAVPD